MTEGRERKIDFLSSGERNGKSPNQKLVSGVADRTQRFDFLSRIELESSVVEGKNPVGEKKRKVVLLQSTTRHVKPRGNLG